MAIPGNIRAHRTRWLLAGGALLMAAALLAAAAAGGVSWPTPDQVRPLLERARGTPWAFPAVCLFYIGGGAVFFPITVTNLITAMVFGALYGTIYGLTGSLLSASLFFWVGHRLGGRALDRLPKKSRLRKIDAKLNEGGVAGIALLRMVPLGPYTLFNIVAGASSVRFAPYIAGTFLALLPGSIARSVVGDSLMDIFLDPTPRTFAWLAAGLALWGAILGATHIFVKRMQKRGTIPPPGR